MNTDRWRGVVQDVVFMPKPSNWCHQRRPIIIAGRSIFRFGGKIMKANKFLGGLTCMDELFTTKIAKCANKINIVNFDFTLTLNQFTPKIVLLKMSSLSGHPRFRWVLDLEIWRKCSIPSLAHQWILWSEWVPSEWESKQLIKTSQKSRSNTHHSTPVHQLRMVWITVMFFIRCLDSHSHSQIILFPHTGTEDPLRAKSAASRPITTEAQSLEEETGNPAQTLIIGDAAVSLQPELLWL